MESKELARSLPRRVVRVVLLDRRVDPLFQDLIRHAWAVPA